MKVFKMMDFQMIKKQKKKGWKKNKKVIVHFK